jgi:hypothetical protein
VRTGADVKGNDGGASSLSAGPAEERSRCGEPEEEEEVRGKEE